MKSTKETNSVSFAKVLHEESISVHYMSIQIPDENVSRSQNHGWLVAYQAKAISATSAIQLRRGETMPGAKNVPTPACACSALKRSRSWIILREPGNSRAVAPHRPFSIKRIAGQHWCSKASAENELASASQVTCVRAIFVGSTIETQNESTRAVGWASSHGW